MHAEIFTGSVLRDARLEDIPQLMRLENSLDDISGLAKWNVARWVYEISNHYVWVIQQGPEIIYVVGFIDYPQEHYIDVIKLTASPVGRPFTSKVIMAGARWLSEHGVLVIRGRCAAHLLDFYKKLGFNEVGEIPNYFGIGVPAFSLERVL